ncbi:hypothetical protein H6P81_009876 [Aristolochia fimbriata]|uniref:Morc S5 domain-containing protein n=1 Tax=Aristolochia fimbriata TaxID=158543 RepID=A0AAV7EQF7_ARIFI|nr:hypothetical protein H6P81_009876 [Aristolochia fimbriata]
MEEEMSVSEVVELYSEEENEDSDVKIIGSSSREKLSASDMKFESSSSGFTAVGSTATAKTGWSTSRMVADQGLPIVEDFSLMAGPPGFEKPMGREFWKAGVAPKSMNGRNHLYVHPKFPHSNATSHEWVFGAVAELLDNAVNEIQNGATFVIVDTFINPQNGTPALLIQDNGGGMDPGALRRCMSFGFSEKFQSLSIRQYGNGFKISSMRIAGNAIVFTRCPGQRVGTQSVGLLSYTSLMATGCGNIVVPMVDYEFSSSMGKFQSLCFAARDIYDSNLSTILQCSPFKSEAELLKQFDDIGHHGTKVILYNLWFNDDGELELDFESDPEDILISSVPKMIESRNLSEMLNQQHYAIRFRYSLRVYAAILYLRLPKTFKMILRGHAVEHHCIVDDLKFHEYVLYKPQVAGKEVKIVTTIGFIKEAPHVNIHGFNVYHKNRLILPFWRVCSSAKGWGVVGVLEVNSIEPMHDKQDFEKCILYERLKTRLRKMTMEYWDYHCYLIGYSQVQRVHSSLLYTDDHLLSSNVKHNPPPTAGLVSSDPVGTCCTLWEGIQKVSAFSPPSQKTSSVENFVSCQGLKSMIGSQYGIDGKRKWLGHVETARQMKRQAVVGENSKFLETECQDNLENQVADVIEVD